LPFCRRQLVLPYCISYSTAGVGKRVRSTSLYRSRQCCNILLNHIQLALVLFSQLSAAFMRHKANDGVAYAI